MDRKIKFPGLQTEKRRDDINTPGKRKQRVNGQLEAK